MRLESIVIGLGLCCMGATPALAQADSAEHNALLFLDAKVFPKKAAACTARISGYSSRFDPAFRAWLSRNQTRIASGEAFLRADGDRNQVPFERDIQSISLAISQQWNAAPLPLLEQNCDELLLQLLEAAQGG